MTTSGGRVEWNPAPGTQNLGRAVMERQAIMDRIRELCTTGCLVITAGRRVVLVSDILAILDDPDPLAPGGPRP